MGYTRIPMPSSGIDAFMTGMEHSQRMFDSFMKNKMTPYQIKLLEAQTQEATGKGAKEQMIANLINGVLGNGNQNPNNITQPILAPDRNEPTMTGNAPPGTFPESGAAPNPLQQHPAGISQTDQERIQALKPGESYVIGSSEPNNSISPPNEINTNQNTPEQMPVQNTIPQGNQTGIMTNPNQKAELASELLGLPVKEETVAGYHYAKNPITGQTTVTRRGQTPEEKSELEMKTSRSKAFSQQDAKLAHDYDTQAMAGENTMETLEKIGTTIDSPEWKEMRTLASLPGGGKTSLWWYAHNGTEAQQKLAGSFISNTGQIVANMAPMFKGQFRKGEQSLINSMKINDTDTVAAAQGKYEALISMEKFITNRSKLMSKLIRQGYSVPDASDQADKTLKGSLIRKMADEKVSHTKNMKSEHSRLKKLADEAIAANPGKKAEILTDLAKLTEVE